MDSRYALEVYAPGCGHDVVVCIESDYLFLAMNPGDLLNLMAWEEYRRDDEKNTVLRIVRIEHMLYTPRDSTNLKWHKMMVFTEAVPNTRETRIG